MTSQRSTSEWTVIARQQAAVAEIGRLGLRGGEFDELLTETLDALSAGMGADAVMLFELTPDGASFSVRGVVVDGRTIVGPDVGGVRIPAGLDSMPGFTVLAGEIVDAPDLLGDDRFSARAPDYHMRSRSAVAAPVGWDDRPWGVLAVYTDDRRRWSTDDLHFVQSMANTLGLAIYRSEAARASADSAARLRSALDAERAARADAELGRKRLHILSELSSSLMSTLDADAAVRAFPYFCVPQIADVCLLDLVDDAGCLNEAAAAAIDEETLETARELRTRRRDLGERGGLWNEAHVARTGERVLLAEIDTRALEAAAEDEAHLDALQRLDPLSSIVVPMVARGRVIGVLSLVSTAASGRTYDEDDLSLVQEMAERAALAHDNGRLFASRHRVARSLQSALLPPALPVVPGLDLAVRHRVAGDDTEIGGDFYDMIEMGDRVWGLVVGDVCGKGPDAAALTGLVRHSVRAAVVRERLPSRVLAQTNDAVIDQIGDTSFCTATFVRVEMGDADGPVRLVATSAGHPAPLLLRAGGHVEVVRSGGVVLGVVESPKSADVEVLLAPGDTVVVYTDGLTEARRSDEQFGEERLTEVLRDLVGRSADDVASVVMEQVEAFADGAGDDRAVLVLRVRPASGN